MKVTHTAIVNWIGIREKTPIRETKNFWVTTDGLKFRKSDGIPSDPQSSVLCFLYIKTIKPI